MLKAEAKEKLKGWGLDVEKLEAAVKAEAETEIELPDVVVFKPTDLQARDANNKAEGKKEGEKEGETKGKELAAKAIKTKFGIEDESKDLAKVVDLVNAKVAAGDPGLKQQNELLIKDKEALQAALDKEKGVSAAAVFDSKLISMFPANRSADLKDNERLMLAKQDLTFEQVDGKTVVKRNGEILRDTATQNPLAPEKVITDYFTERKWVAGSGANGGRGGGDNNPAGAGGLKKLSQVQEQWQKDNPNGNLVSPEFQQHLETVTKDAPDFDFYN
jgi:hypothetical protein